MQCWIGLQSYEAQKDVLPTVLGGAATLGLWAQGGPGAVGEQKRGALPDYLLTDAHPALRCAPV